ncbi:protein PET100 homolog, mitochondrial isoform X2 [Meriones unguiculatus]|uniref:protein PET100 homolog, mitochondrial isoform X2 n=1 Tax=Meriones unguiculatus TaxID=10047 RepID=UPI00293F32C4|nr:protein PET100 homolog, mitochondrial isoform X2 [Meriones unguiculatus]
MTPGGRRTRATLVPRCGGVGSGRGRSRDRKPRPEVTSAARVRLSPRPGRKRGAAQRRFRAAGGAMGVKLEVFRMSLYLTFPVVMFWVSNQAGWFEESVVRRKLREMEEFKRKLRRRREERLLQAARQSP